MYSHSISILVFFSLSLTNNDCMIVHSFDQIVLQNLFVANRGFWEKKVLKF